MAAQPSHSLRTFQWDRLCGTENRTHTTRHSEPAPALQSPKAVWNVGLRRCPVDAVGVFLLVYFPGNSHHGQGTSVVQKCLGTADPTPQIHEWKRSSAGDVRRAFLLSSHFPAVRTSPGDCRVLMALTDGIPGEGSWLTVSVAPAQR